MNTPGRKRGRLGRIVMTTVAYRTGVRSDELVGTVTVLLRVKTHKHVTMSS